MHILHHKLQQEVFLLHCVSCKLKFVPCTFGNILCCIYIPSPIIIFYFILLIFLHHPCPFLELIQVCRHSPRHLKEEDRLIFKMGYKEKEALEKWSGESSFMFT